MTAAQIDRVRAASDLLAIAGEYRPLTKRGPEYWCKCLFHEEKSASLHFHPSKGIYRCFGCNASGDVFKFVQAMEGVSFPQALRALAERAGIDLDSTPRLTGEELWEAERRRKQDEERAEDCLMFREAWLNRIAAEKADIRRMNRSFNQFAVAKLATGDLTEAQWEWADTIMVLTERADRLWNAIGRILDAEPRELKRIYLAHRAAQPLTREAALARVESKRHAFAVTEALVDVLAGVQA